MSDVVKLAARLPGEAEVNGIDAMQGQLVANPSQVIVALAWFDVLRITENVELGTKVPTIQVLRIEPVGPAAEIPAALADIALDAAQRRLGHEPLPFAVTDPAGLEVYSAGPDDDPARAERLGDK